MVVKKEKKLTASLEDYLEVILNLSADGSVARSMDIASSLEVSRSSVTGALKELAGRGLINYKPYAYITLTDIGLREAQRIAAKHEIIAAFFVNILGVDRSVAQKAACKAEHALGPKIVSRLLRFVKFVSENNNDGFDLAGRFGQYCRKNQNDSNGD
jgi:DtxR family transcriptional regulator, Mn-dependent transcriptional regulator